MDTNEILDHQRRERAFAATPLGRAFRAFESKVAAAWVKNTEPNTSDRRLREVWDQHAQARRDLMVVLLPLALPVQPADTAAPPAGAEPGTLHWLYRPSGGIQWMVAAWSGEGWDACHGRLLKPAEMTWWRYVCPAYPPTISTTAAEIAEYRAEKRALDREADADAHDEEMGRG